MTDELSRYWPKLISLSAKQLKNISIVQPPVLFNYAVAMLTSQVYLGFLRKL